MSYELYYTSSQKGLQPGSHGFCTVACSKGMPVPLIEKIEALSGYRPLFPPSDPKASSNPVSFAHAQVSLAGKTYQVLSRICFAGLDYSDRTNKFAHHVVLEPHELPPGGPAWLLRQPGFMVAQWDGQVGYLGSRVPPRGDAPPAACREWQRSIGDAGWAGALADSFLKNPDRPVYFLYDLGNDLLPLLAEVTSLLPAEQRWQVTFNTYLPGLSQSIPCAWRGVLKSSEDAAQLRKMPGVLVIALGERMPALPSSPLVEAARTGKIAASPMAVPPAIPASGGAARPVPVALPAPGSHQGIPKPVAAPRILPPPLVQAGLETAGAPRRRAAFGVGMAVGVVASLIPLGALVMAGVVLIPSAGFGPSHVTVAASEKPIEFEIPTPADKEGQSVKEFAKIKEENKKLLGLNEKLTIEKNAAQLEVQNLKAGQKQPASVQEQINQALIERDSQHAKELEKSKAAIKEKEELIQSQTNQITLLQNKLDAVPSKEKEQILFGDPKLIVLKSFRDFRLSDKEEPERIMLATMSDEKKGFSFGPAGKTFNFRQEITRPEKKEDKHKHKLSLSIKLTGDMNQTAELAKIWLTEKGEVLPPVFEPLPKDSQFFKLQQHLKDIFPNQVLAIRTKSGKEYFVSLHDTPKVSKAPDFQELGKKVQREVSLWDPKTIATLRTHLWFQELEGDSKPHLWPVPGAKVFLVIDNRWLVEIHRQP